MIFICILLELFPLLEKPVNLPNAFEKVVLFLQKTSVSVIGVYFLPDFPAGPWNPGSPSKPGTPSIPGRPGKPAGAVTSSGCGVIPGAPCRPGRPAHGANDSVSTPQKIHSFDDNNDKKK